MDFEEAVEVSITKQVELVMSPLNQSLGTWLALVSSIRQTGTFYQFCAYTRGVACFHWISSVSALSV